MTCKAHLAKQSAANDHQFVISTTLTFLIMDKYCEIYLLKNMDKQTQTEKAMKRTIINSILLQSVVFVL